ncbi:MAG: hypothetical protein ACI9VR_001385 [Cognaticolwellia sp.]|jgi:hypothetical protein
MVGCGSDSRSGLRIGSRSSYTVFSGQHRRQARKNAVSRRIFVVGYLIVEELDRLYTRESNGGLKHRLQVVYLARKGWPSKQICEATPFGRDWSSSW